MKANSSCFFNGLDCLKCFSHKDSLLQSFQPWMGGPKQLEVGQHVAHHDRAILAARIERHLILLFNGKANQDLGLVLQDAPHSEQA